MKLELIIESAKEEVATREGWRPDSMMARPIIPSDVGKVDWIWAAKVPNAIIPTGDILITGIHAERVIQVRFSRGQTAAWGEYVATTILAVLCTGQTFYEPLLIMKRDEVMLQVWPLDGNTPHDFIFSLTGYVLEPRGMTVAET